MKNKQLTPEELNTLYLKDYYTNAEAYANALIAVLKAKKRDPEAIKVNLQFLAKSLGFNLVKEETGEIEKDDD